MMVNRKTCVGEISEEVVGGWEGGGLRDHDFSWPIVFVVNNSLRTLVCVITAICFLSLIVRKEQEEEN